MTSDCYSRHDSVIFFSSELDSYAKLSKNIVISLITFVINYAFFFISSSCINLSRHPKNRHLIHQIFPATPTTSRAISRARVRSISCSLHIHGLHRHTHTHGGRLESTHLSEGRGGRAWLLGLVRRCRDGGEGCVGCVRRVRRVRRQRRVVLLAAAVTPSATHLEVWTGLVAVVPSLLLHHHACERQAGILLDYCYSILGWPRLWRGEKIF